MSIPFVLRAMNLLHNCVPFASVIIIESLRNTTRLLMTSRRSLETSPIFRFAPMLAKGWRDRARF